MSASIFSHTLSPFPLFRCRDTPPYPHARGSPSLTDTEPRPPTDPDYPAELEDSSPSTKSLVFGFFPSFLSSFLPALWSAVAFPQDDRIRLP